MSCYSAYQVVATPYTVEYDDGVWEDEDLHTAPLGALIHPASRIVGQGCTALDRAAYLASLLKNPIVPKHYWE